MAGYCNRNVMRTCVIILRYVYYALIELWNLHEETLLFAYGIINCTSLTETESNMNGILLDTCVLKEGEDFFRSI